MELQTVANEVLSGALLAVLSLLVAFLWKLPKTLTQLTSSITDLNVLVSKQTNAMNEMEQRIEVHDAIFSDLAGQSVNSHRISKGLDSKPVFGKLKKVISE